MFRWRFVRRPTTAATYRATLDRKLLPKFQSRKIGSLGINDITAYIRSLEDEGLKPTSVAAYLQPLRSILKFAVKRGYIASNPCDLLTTDDRPHTDEEPAEIHEWTNQELDDLVAVAERMARQSEARFNYSPAIKVAAETGLRIGELLGLQWQDIDFKDGAIHVRRQWLRTGAYGPPKTKKGIRRVPISHGLVAYLRDLKMRSSFSLDDHPVFVSRKGKPLGHRNLTARGFEPAAERAGIEGVSFHSLRHAYGSRLADQGISSTVIAQVMGHESAATTERIYLHNFNRQRSDDAVRKAMAR